MDYPELATALRGVGVGLVGTALSAASISSRNRPNTIRDPERHRWRHPQGFMRAAEIVERDVQAHGGKVAIDLFAKAVAQSSKPF